jgi:hypothetical protein
MLLFDFSGFFLNLILAALGTGETLDISDYRKVFFTRFLDLKSRFKGDDNIVFALDSNTGYWRKDFFPYYKASRKASRDASKHNWDEIFKNMDIIIQDLESFPYKVLRIDKAEADDIIAILTKKYQKNQDVVIFSSDKDFLALQKYENVSQFSFSKNCLIYPDSKTDGLFEHIIKGDASDGVPNILSDDNHFIIKSKRQEPITTNRLQILKETLNKKEDLLLVRNFERNQTLIDFDYIPTNIQIDILRTFKSIEFKKFNIIKYLTDNNLRIFLNRVNEF